MKLPLHLLRLQPSPSARDSETVHLVSRSDVVDGRPLFRAPALPTPHQFSSDLPFTVNYGPRLRERP
jgi:hypothetical protein